MADASITDFPKRSLWEQSQIECVTDLAARSRPRASGPRLLSRASWTRTMASVLCSSRGFSDAASNGTAPSVRASDNCSHTESETQIQHSYTC